MACGCQGGVKAWVYTDAEGKTFEFRTEVQALALKINNGGQGEVTPKR